MKKIGFIGAGNMGGALASAVAKSGNSLFISDACEEKAQTLANELCATAVSTDEIINICDVIFLGVKPQVLPALAAQISGEVAKRGADCTLISMAAGISTEQLSSLFLGAKLIRIMPNTPVAVGEGVILYSLGNNADSDDEATLLSCLAAAGSLIRIDEKLIDAATAVSGCGPAFVYMFIEALADGGVKCGLPRELSTELAAKTLLGASKLCIKSGKHPGELKDAVCSPGGSTIAGVAALEEGAFRATAIGAVEAAHKKTKELSGKK